MGRRDTHTQCTNEVDTHIGFQDRYVSSFSLHDSFRNASVVYGFKKLQGQSVYSCGNYW